VILQLGVFNQAFSNGRAFFRLRTNADQRDALGVSVRGASQLDYNGDIVPLVVAGPRTLEYSLDVTGTISVTLWITVVGYIV